MGVRLGMGWGGKLEEEYKVVLWILGRSNFRERVLFIYFFFFLGGGGRGKGELRESFC